MEKEVILNYYINDNKSFDDKSYKIFQSVNT